MKKSLATQSVEHKGSRHSLDRLVRSLGFLGALFNESRYRLGKPSMLLLPPVEDLLVAVIVCLLLNEQMEPSLLMLHVTLQGLLVKVVAPFSRALEGLPSPHLFCIAARRHQNHELLEDEYARQSEKHGENDRALSRGWRRWLHRCWRVAHDLTRMGSRATAGGSELCRRI